MALVVVFGACSSGSATPTVTARAPSAVATSAGGATAPAPAATKTADPLANPDADGQQIYDVVQHLAVDIGPRLAGTPGE
ncbi:MAG: hypothetical protein ACREMU_03595, partial [Gemmatimonadaceae bacterium]